MKKRKFNLSFIFPVFFALFFLFLPIIPVSSLSINYSQEIEEIQKQIEDQQNYLLELEKQREVYEKNIKIKRNEALSLKNEISLLDNQISQREIEIMEKEAEINTTNLLIKNIQLKILQKKEEINALEENLSSILRKIHQAGQKNYLEIIFLNNSISQVLIDLRFLNSLQGDLAYFLKKYDLIKEGLEIQEKDLRVQLQKSINLQEELKNKKSKIQAEKAAQENLLNQTRGAEWKFQSLLAEVVGERKAIENEIIELESTVRKKIAQEKEEKIDLMEKEGIIVFSWPIPFNGITCQFHDPDYPYRNWIGEHSGLDLRASQGTAVRAAASGYVARTKHAGLGYSYIMIIHNDSFSTLYGHMSEILVEEGEYIKRGTIIGRSGGLPGTTGAGSFSTGPHLHFEVRLNGLPVNPEDYLL